MSHYSFGLSTIFFRELRKKVGDPVSLRTQLRQKVIDKSPYTREVSACMQDL
jgi:hypothetical protein